MDHSSVHIPDTNGYSPLALFACTLLGSILTNMTKEEIVFWITVVTGCAGTISYLVRAVRDWKDIKAKLKAKRNRKNEE